VPVPPPVPRRFHIGGDTFCTTRIPLLGSVVQTRFPTEINSVENQHPVGMDFRRYAELRIPPRQGGTTAGRFLLRRADPADVRSGFELLELPAQPEFAPPAEWPRLHHP